MPTPSPARVHDVAVVSNEPIARDVCALVIHAPALAEALVPGQFLSIAVPGNAFSLLRIPLSYAAADPAGGTVEIWYAIVGEGTERLAHLRPGDTTTVLGPGGHGWTVPAGARRCLLVAGGIGMPPIFCLAERILATTDASVRVIAGAKTASALVGVDELAAAGDRLELMIATDDGTAGHQGFTTDLVDEALAAGDAYDYVATCGPEPMMAKVAAAAAQAGVPCEASLERMMSCGFGACATCAVETTGGMKGACMCGPVFDAKEVVW